MYPQPELIRLAAHKAALRRSLARHRAASATAAIRVAEPLEHLDRILAAGRRLAPFAPLLAVPLGYWAARASLPRMLQRLWRWGPLVAGGLRGIKTLVTARAGGRARATPAAAIERASKKSAPAARRRPGSEGV